MPRNAGGSVLATQLSTQLTEPRLTPIASRAGSKLERYRRDPFAHIEDGHIWIEDLVSGEPVQLDPWPHQEEITRAWINLDHLARTGEPRYRNVREEKSRQEGVTWWIAYLEWWALTHHDAPGLAVFPTIGDAADSGFTTDSFFGRIRFINDYGTREGEEGGVPDYLRPTLLFTGGNDPSIRNVVRAQAFLAAAGATPNPGRGKRYRRGFLDEFAYHPFDRAAHRSLTRSIPSGRFYNSTPHGEDNVYAWLGKVRPRGYVYLRHHWSEHPLYGEGAHVAALVDDETGDVIERGQRGCKLCAGTLAGLDYDPTKPLAHRYPGKLTSPWFEDAVTEMTDEDVASELEIDYTASLAARVYPEFSDELHVAIEPIEAIEGVKVELAWDYGVDTTSVVVCQDTPVEYRIIGEVEAHDALPEEVARAVKAELVAVGLDPLHMDPEWIAALTMSVGDPAGEARQQATGRPLTAEYRQHGFAISSRPQRIDFTIRAVKRLFGGKPKPVVVSPRCTKFIQHAKHNRWPVDRQGNRKPGVTEPLNDQHNHMMRAFAYLIAWKFPPPSTTEGLMAALRPDRPDRRGEHVYEVDARTGKVDAGIGYDMDM